MTNQVPIEKWVEVREKAVRYHVAGVPTAPPVLLFHGAGIDNGLLSWGELIPELAENFYVIAPDAPGYGDSERHQSFGKVADFADWECDFMDAIGVERAHMIGMSMGGGIAAWLGVHAPERVDKLVLVGAYGLGPKVCRHLFACVGCWIPWTTPTFYLSGRSAFMSRMALRFLVKDVNQIKNEDFLRLRQEAALAIDADVFQEFQRQEIRWPSNVTNLENELPRVEADTLIIHGPHDRLVPIEQSVRAAELIPNARFFEMDTGHWPMREEPYLFNKTVIPFLLGLD